MKGSTMIHINRADSARVKRLTDAMVSAFEGAIHEMQEGGIDVKLIDGFMAAHNLHKFVVLHMAGEHGAKHGTPEFEVLAKVAVDTFRAGLEKGR